METLTPIMVVWTLFFFFFFSEKIQLKSLHNLNSNFSFFFFFFEEEEEYGFASFFCKILLRHHLSHIGSAMMSMSMFLEFNIMSLLI